MTPGTGRRGCTLLLVAVVAGPAAGCGPDEEASWLTGLRRDLPADTALHLPATEPPDLVDAGVGSGNGIPIVSFSTRNEPTVSVCQAEQARCRTVLPVAVLVPRPQGPAEVTVLVELPEAGVPSAVPDALWRFWSQVELVPGRPAWLGEP